LYTQAILPPVVDTTGAEGNGALNTCSRVKEACAQAQVAEASAAAMRWGKRILIDYSRAAGDTYVSGRARPRRCTSLERTKPMYLKALSCHAATGDPADA
jgi:hypothetical protein